MAKTTQSVGYGPEPTKMVYVQIPNPGLVKGDIFSFLANSGFNRTWISYRSTVPETKDGRPPSGIRLKIPVAGDFPSSAKVEVKDVKVVKKRPATKGEVGLQSIKSIIESMTPSEFQVLCPGNESEAEKFQRHVDQVRGNVGRMGWTPLPSSKPTPSPASSAPNESQGMRHELLSLRSTNQTLMSWVSDLRKSNEALTKKSSTDAGTIKRLQRDRECFQRTCIERAKALEAKERKLEELGQKLAAKERQLANSRCETDSTSLKRSMSSLCSNDGNKKRMRAFLHPDKLPKEDQRAAKTVRDILKL